ncbi:hypothetical protein [Treponema zioleckii]|uniref:hypothetical protein n=1 Tax=Treponema zioleckii TaxID=331680 RepID=UPI00168BACCE|nr:hypothetical protein [Treponema zioleckii]
MKKIFTILTAALLAASGFLFTSCAGEDGDDGLSATELILNETGNKWYKYTDTSEENSVPTTQVSNSSNSFTGNIYLKYDTSSDNLIMVVAGDNYYATK